LKRRLIALSPLRAGILVSCLYLFMCDFGRAASMRANCG
jgi:hypothetical protein